MGVVKVTPMVIAARLCESPGHANATASAPEENYRISKTRYQPQ